MDEVSISSTRRQISSSRESIIPSSKLNVHQPLWSIVNETSSFSSCRTRRSYLPERRETRHTSTRKDASFTLRLIPGKSLVSGLFGSIWKIVSLKPMGKWWAKTWTTFNQVCPSHLLSHRSEDRPIWWWFLRIDQRVTTTNACQRLKRSHFSKDASILSLTDPSDTNSFFVRLLQNIVTLFNECFHCKTSLSSLSISDSERRMMLFLCLRVTSMFDMPVSLPHLLRKTSRSTIKSNASSVFLFKRFVQNISFTRSNLEQNNSMATMSNNASVPLEISHQLFNGFDATVILAAVRDIHQQLEAVVNVKQHHELDFTSMSKDEFHQILRRVRPQSITSVTLSDEEKTPGTDRCVSLVFAHWRCWMSTGGTCDQSSSMPLNFPFVVWPLSREFSMFQKKRFSNVSLQSRQNRVVFILNCSMKIVGIELTLGERWEAEFSFLISKEGCRSSFIPN